MEIIVNKLKYILAQKNLKINRKYFRYVLKKKIFPYIILWKKKYWEKGISLSEVNEK